MRQDLLYAIRTLRKDPGFTFVVVISIALGIAANTTVFSIVNGLLLGELPVREPDRLVSFASGRTFSWPDYQDYLSGTKPVFEDIAATFPLVPANVGGRGEPERVWGQLGSGNYFRVHGVDIAIGRGFLPEEDQVPGRNPVIVLSHGLWTRRFGGDRDIVGSDILVNGFPYKVIGIAQRGYAGSVRAIVSEFWVPLAMRAQIMPDMNRPNMITGRDTQWVMLHARLRPGISNEQATAAVRVVQQRIQEQFRKGKPARAPMELGPAGQLMDGLAKAALGLTVVMMIVVGLVLMIACANVANILLARATARQKEIGVRLAVGASRGRLLRQLLTESVLLSVLGAAVGFLAASWAARGLSQFRIPLPIPIELDFNADLRVFLFTAVLAVLTGIVFGLAPALRATRPDLVNSLKHTVAPLGGHRRFGLRNALVVVQVALSLVLLVGAGLFLRSLQHVSSIDPGLQPDGVVLMAFDPKLNQYTPERTKQMLSQLRERVETLPGVTSVSYLDSIPLSIGGTSYDFTTHSGKDGVKETNADVYTVGARYFETMGVAIVRGREFDRRADASVPAAIINEHMAAKLFGSEDPVGRQISAAKKTYRIAGVARDSKSRTLAEAPVAMAYLFLEAAPEEVMSIYGISIVAKSATPAQALTRAIRDQIHALDPHLAVFNVSTMREQVDKALLLPRVCALLLAIFGATGLALAMVGLYGVISFSVRSRTKEIGIRMALGAGERGVLSMVTRQGLALTAVGLAIGLAISLALTRFVASFLYGVSAMDAVTFAAVPLALLLIAAVAVLVPARRASRVDPLVALRYE